MIRTPIKLLALLSLLVIVLAGFSGLAAAEETPTPPASPARNSYSGTIGSNAALPTALVPIPQPSAFFVPRLITVTIGISQGGSRLQGRVVDWRGNPISGVGLRVASTEEFTATTAQDGSYAIDALPPGSYTVAVAGYGGVPVTPLAIDGQSSYLVEFMEAAPPTTPTITPVVTATLTPTPTPTATATARATHSATATVSSASSATPAASGTPRPTATPKPEPPLLSPSDADYLKRMLLTPFALGAAGGYLVFLFGIFGASLRR